MLEYEFIKVKDWLKLMSVMEDEGKVRTILKEENERRRQILLKDKLAKELIK